MWEKIKQHPWIAGAAIGVLLLVLLLSSSSTTSAASPGAPAADASNGDQLQAYLAALNLQGQQVSAAATASHEQTAAAVTVAQINSSSQDKANELAAQVAEYTTKLQSDVLINRDTMTAVTSQKQIQAGVDTTQIVANALVQQNAIAADVTKSYIQSLPALIQAQYSGQASVAQASQQHCTSFAFGLFSSC